LGKALGLYGTVRVDVEALERMRMQVILLLKCSVVKLLDAAVTAVAVVMV
jgi:hypothetical protein